MKKQVRECKNCKEDTIHLVKRVCFKPHSSGQKSGGTKYIMEHCTKCNKRWYDGKVKREIRTRKSAHTKI